MLRHSELDVERPLNVAVQPFSRRKLDVHEERAVDAKIIMIIIHRVKVSEEFSHNTSALRIRVINIYICCYHALEVDFRPRWKFCWCAYARRGAGERGAQMRACEGER